MTHRIDEEKAKNLLIKAYAKRQVRAMTIEELLASVENTLVDNYRTYLSFEEVKFIIQKDHPDLLGKGKREGDGKKAS